MSGTASPPVPPLVVASAGTGKTTRLALAYLALLLREPAETARPEAQLASTFTRKAAGEILDRIVVELLAAAAGAPSEPVAKALAGLRDPTTARALVLGLLRRLHRVRVGTLDSFFAGVAQAFAAELGLPPGWRIAPEAELAELRTEAIDAALREAPQSAAQLAHLLREAAGGEPRAGVADLLDTFLATYEPLLREAPAAAWTPAFGGEGLLDTPALAAALAALAAVPLPTTKQGTPNRTWRSRVNADLELLRAGAWVDVAKGTLVQACWQQARTGTPQTFAKVALDDAVVAAYLPLIRHAARAHLQERLATLAPIRNLVTALVGAADRRQLERGRYRFGDIPRSIAHADDPLRASELYYRLDGRIEHMLLDEFQDTSLVQWRALTPLVAEVAAVPARTLFVVGDPKQSIYGWRGGLPELCEADVLAAELPSLGGLQPETLEVNYRSAPEVLRFVDEVFAALPGAAAPGSDDHRARVDGFDHFRRDYPAHGHVPRPEAPPGQAALLAFAGVEHGNAHDSGDDAGGGDPRLRFAAERIVALASEVPGAELGVLVRRNAPLNELVAHLKAVLSERALLEAIEVSEEGGGPVTDAVGPAVLLSLLRLAAHPGDTAAWYHVATSALAPELRRRLGTAMPAALARATARQGAAAAERLAQNVRAELAANGLGPTLHRWRAALEVAALPGREQQRLEQLLGLAHAWDREGRPGDPAAFVAHAEAARLDSPRRARIRVMTIHQSKGLAFDVVVLPELWHRLVQGGGAPPPIVVRRGHSPLGAVAAIVPAPRTAVLPLLDGPGTAAIPDAWRAARAREYHEAFANLYVALTRARHACYAFVYDAPDAAKADTLPSTAAQFLERRALQLVPDGAAATALPAALVDGAVLLAHGDSAWRTRFAAPPAADAPDAPRWTPPPPGTFATAATPWRLFERAAPSEPDPRTGVRAADLLGVDRDRARAMRRGEAIHACFELVEWLDAAAPTDDALHARLAALDLGPGARAERIAEFRALLAAPDLRAALSAAGQRARGGPWAAAATLEAQRERRFVLRDRADRLFSGAIDRLVVARAADGAARAAEVLDFKTDAVADEAALAAKAEHYRSQLEAYRRAAAGLLGLDPTAVTMRLAFVGAGRVVTLPADKDSG